MEHLPVELVERIVEELDLESVRSMRLLCRELSQKSCGPAFQQFIKRQRQCLTRTGLQTLLSIATHPVLGPAVREVTLVACVFDSSAVKAKLKEKGKTVPKNERLYFTSDYVPFTPAELSEMTAELEWFKTEKRQQREFLVNGTYARMLTDAFRSFGQLASLSLQATVIRGHGRVASVMATRYWNPVWIAASNAYRLTTSAIAQSKIGIETLLIFSELHRCSVPSFDIGAHMPSLDHDGFGEAAAKIKRMSISMSTKVETDYEKVLAIRESLTWSDDLEAYDLFGSTGGLLASDDPTAIAMENYNGPAELLSKMPALQELDLHFYKTLQGLPKTYDRIFTLIADCIHLADLRRLKLRGIYAREDDLISFLDRHASIQTLELHGVHLTQGEWPRVFARLCDMPILETVELSNLWGQKLLNLKFPNESLLLNRENTLRCARGLLLPARSLSRKHLDAGLPFQMGDLGYMMGSPEASQWRDLDKLLYGTP